MNAQNPIKRSPSLTIAPTAITQVKQYKLTREIVLDVMKNRSAARKLPNGQIQFGGSPNYPNIIITAGFLAQKNQWVITDVTLQQEAPARQADRTPQKIDKRDTSLPAIKLTKHAQALLKTHPLEQQAIAHVIQYPKTRQNEKEDKVRFTGNLDDQTLVVVARFLPKEQQWLIITFSLLKPKKPQAPLFQMVLTDRAKDVLRQEFLDARIIEDIIQNPAERLDEQDKVRFIKKVSGDVINVIAKYLSAEQKWLVITIELRHKQDRERLSLQSEFEEGAIDENTLWVTFTRHALERMELRKISRTDVKETLLNPEKRFDKDDGTTRFISQALSLNRTIHVVASFVQEDNAWNIISTWVRGEEDDGSLSNYVPKRATRKDDSPVRLTHKARTWLHTHNVSQSEIIEILNAPQQKIEQPDGKVKFISNRRADSRAIHIIAEWQSSQEKWLVITAWLARSQNVARYGDTSRHSSRRYAKSNKPQASQSAGGASFGVVLGLGFIVLVVFFLLYLFGRLGGIF